MRTAARPRGASHVDLAAPARPWCEPVAQITAEARRLLAQDLTESQRRAVLAIVHHAEHLAREFGAPTSEHPPLLSPETVVEGANILPAGPAPNAGTWAAPSETLGPGPTPASTSSSAGHARILIADDDDQILELLTEILGDRYDLTLARDGAEAVTALAGQHFNLAIVDLNLPILDGFGVAEALRLSERPSPPFMFLSAQASPQAKVRGLELGAADYVTKPFDADELTARIARIFAAVTREATLRADAMTDSLTGLCNYRSFTESLGREVERSRRYAQPLSLITVDLDHLKAINDEHGHDAGNQAIVLLANVLKGAVRSFDVVARNGGDEFALLLPNTIGSEALALARRLRDALAEHPLRGARLTASMGVASRHEDSDLDGAALVKASDDALYRAKRAGRDRVELARVR